MMQSPQVNTLSGFPAKCGFDEGCFHVPYSHYRVQPPLETCKLNTYYVDLAIISHPKDDHSYRDIFRSL